MNSISTFWNEFLTSYNLPSNTPYYEAFYFDTNKESAKHLLQLVLSGKKTATASSYEYYKATNEALPEIGSYSIVTDYDNIPYAVIQTTNIEIIPFKDLTFDTVKREGEDKNLESWREKHIAFYKYDGKQNGYTFTEDMKVVFEDFRLVYSKDPNQP